MINIKISLNLSNKAIDPALVSAKANQKVESLTKSVLVLARIAKVKAEDLAVALSDESSNAAYHLAMVAKLTELELEKAKAESVEDVK